MGRDFSLYCHVLTWLQSNRYRGRVKWSEHDADLSPPSSAKIKNVWSFISITFMHLHGMVLKHMDMFSFSTLTPLHMYSVLMALAPLFYYVCNKSFLADYDLFDIEFLIKCIS
jgi:hypothetical protein